MEKILQWMLYGAAKIVLARHHPKIVAITGNVGKTSTKEAVFAVLSSKYSVRRGEKNYNNEIGVPLAILDWPHYGKNIFGWLWLFLKLPEVLFSKYPRILVLEMGADHPGDIKYLARLARPDIAIITEIGEIPVHVEFFGTPEKLAEEKAELLKALPFSGHAILNADDPRVRVMAKLTNAAVSTFGTAEDADYRAEHWEIRYAEENGVSLPEGISFKLAHAGSVIPVRLAGSLSLPQVRAAAAAFAAGVEAGMNPLSVAEALKNHIPPAGRLRILKGVKESLILDDTYNAAPAAMESALETLKTLRAKRKIAVLGDMLELGEYAEAAHRKIGKIAADVADILILVGERMRFAAEEARIVGFDPRAIHEVSNSKNVSDLLYGMIQPGDLILVKGSQGIRMERVVEGVMAEPEKVGAMLVRQTADWKAKA